MDIKHIPKKPLPAIYSWLGDRIFLTVIIILGLSIILMTAGLALVTSQFTRPYFVYEDRGAYLSA
jgi:hypothetical protein